ncbi:MAG TPA: anthranilate synthase component I family protein [Chloroflexia bacterium]|nr:anthranilate synthase component I family protein [Chloroflexia bacterium]
MSTTIEPGRVLSPVAAPASPGELTPDLATVRQLAADLGAPRRSGAPVVPVMRRIYADLDTPVSAYLKLTAGETDQGYSFLLESVHGGEHPARYSFLGAAPGRVLRVDPAAGNPLPALAAEADRWQMVRPPGLRHPLPPFLGGAVGFVSYEAAGTFEPVPLAAHDPHGLPLALFGVYDTVIAFDHAYGVMQVISLASLAGDVDAAYATAAARIAAVCARLAGPLPAVVGSRQYAVGRDEGPDEGLGVGGGGLGAGSGGREPGAGEPTGHRSPVTDHSSRNPKSKIQNPKSNCAPAEYEAMVRQAKEHISAGDIIQVVVSQRFTRPTHAAPFATYRALRSLNPSPYMFYLQLDTFQLIGASPEMLVQVRDGQVTTHPIAGTRPRGASASDDAALAASLRADPKERAEHLMLVDLARNDVGRVAAIGTVQVPVRFQIEHYSHVMHLVSQVTGTLRPDRTALDALQACFPAGTLSGAPKVRAMQIIAALERDARGPYGGAVGYLSASGNLDMAITIRTIMLRDGVATVQAGAGIVADSVPATEREESENKARALLVALDLAERGL